MEMRSFAVMQDQPADACAPLEPGCSVGSCLILDRLSASRYATVYLAHDVAVDRLIVLKTLAPNTDPAEIANLRHEARALARARNPSLVTLYALVDSGAVPVLVLEHLVGETLAQRLARRGPLSVAVASELFIKLLAGLEQMHRAGVIHGNIKSDNIFLTTEGEPKFLGLQLAVFRHGSAGPATRSPDLLYCAPEHRGLPATDPRADLFSLGLCLDEALTGSLSFETRGPPGRRRSVPPGLLTVLARATSKDPAARFPSAIAFRQALAAATPNARWWSRSLAGRPRAMRLVRALAFDATLLALLAGLVFALGLYPRTEPTEQTAAIDEAAPNRAPAGKGSLRRPVGTTDKPDKYDALRRAWGG